MATTPQIVPVSVVIPCYRCAATIERAIASVIQQTQRPKELILVEDGSGDDTLAVLQKLAEPHADWIKIIALPKNQGVSHARNVGWDAATQDYIAFLDADDTWHPQKVEIQINYMLNNQNVGMCAHQHCVLSPDKSLPKETRLDITAKPVKKYELLLSNLFTPSTVMLRTDLPFQFSEGKQYMEDHLLWLEIIFNNIFIVKLDVTLAAQYKQAYGISGLSANLWLMEKGELQNYYHLYHKRYINFLYWVMLTLYSLVKFVRRLLITSVRRLTTSRDFLNSFQ